MKIITRENDLLPETLTSFPRRILPGMFEPRELVPTITLKTRSRPLEGDPHRHQVLVEKHPRCDLFLLGHELKIEQDPERNSTSDTVFIHTVSFHDALSIKELRDAMIEDPVFCVIPFSKISIERKVLAPEDGHGYLCAFLTNERKLVIVAEDFATYNCPYTLAQKKAMKEQFKELPMVVGKMGAIQWMDPENKDIIAIQRLVIGYKEENDPDFSSPRFVKEST